MSNTNNNTGRTVTIQLDNLGNAEIMNLYQMLTGYTGNIWEGDEEDALPAADSDAACEVFLHVAETANARVKNADAAQRDFINGILEEYREIFGEDEDQDETPANEDAPALIDYPGFIDAAVKVWRDDLDNIHHDAALEANARDTNEDPNNLYRAGVFAGLAEAAAWAIYNNCEADDINAITAAIYKAYGVAW